MIKYTETKIDPGQRNVMIKAEICDVVVAQIWSDTRLPLGEGWLVIYRIRKPETSDPSPKSEYFFSLRAAKQGVHRFVKAHLLANVWEDFFEQSPLVEME